MTIKTKLTLNVGVVSIAIVIIVASALVGTKKINFNIQELTQKTTPYQLKALNQQRELQAHATNLVNLSASRTLEEYKRTAAGVSESMDHVNKASDEMAKLKGEGAAGDKTIAEITRSILEITEQKIKAQESALAASVSIQARLSEASKKMNDLGFSIGTLQQQSSVSMFTSVDSMMEANQQQHNLAVIRDGLKDLTLSISKIPMTGDKRSVAVLRDGVTSTIKTVSQALRNLKGADKVANETIQQLAALNERVTASRGIAFLQIKYIGEEDEKQKELIATRAKEAVYELSYILPTIEKEVRRADGVLKSNTNDMSRNIDAFKDSNRILAQTSNLSVLSSSLVMHINNCIFTRNMKDFTQETSAVEGLFRQANRAGQDLKNLLAQGKHAKELQVVTGYMTSMSAITTAFSGGGGVADRVKAAIKSREELENLNNRMRAVAGKYLEESKKEVVKAGANQEDVVTSLNRTASRTVQMVMGVGGLVVVVTLLMGIFISRSITSPLKASIGVIQTIAEGDLTREMDCVSSDEIGELAQSVNTMRVKMGDAVGQSAATSQKLSRGVLQQAASLEETSASLEEMASMVKRNAENTAQANELMIAAKGVTQTANSSMTELTGSMTEITKASEQTQKIVKKIDEIAFQTNLLALNAAVEAARAGEAGAGFAVVAEEVRRLALSAAEAAKQTSHLMEDIAKKIKTGESLVISTNSAFQQVTDSSNKVVDLMKEVAAASRDQAQGIDQIGRAVSEMNTVTQANAASAHELAAIMEIFKIHPDGAETVGRDDGEAAPSGAALPPVNRAAARAASAARTTDLFSGATT